MAASSSSSRNVTIYAVDDAEPIIVDGSTFVSEPDMTSVEDTIWGEELMIPHKLRGRTLAFAGPLPSSDNFNEDVRKRNLMASSEAEGPIKQKKQKALTIQEPSSAGNVNPTIATPSGESQRDKRKAGVETSEASMPPNPKKKTEKKKKKKVISKSNPSAEIEKETENSVSDPPVEDQPSTHVETPSTEGPILEKVNPNLQDPGTQGDNEEQPTAPFNNDEAWIDKEANEGIKAFSASAAVEEEIQNLMESSKVLDKEVASFKSLYEDLKTKF
ncbi:hypothetical protein P8452_77640 [Trifolium repens]|nr:hypothetical protein P8452_65011 [Trifolium repens]WJX96432.1 hypothetical protein P8452_77640 [Trifolium repens]